MAPDVLLGLTLGGAIGGLNAAASYGFYRLVRERSDVAFYAVTLLGLVGRMGVALVLVALVLVLAPVHFPAFIGALLVSVVVGLVTETLLIYREPARPAGGAAAPPRTTL